MPELPEVETVTQGIRTNLINKKIKQVTVYRRDLRFSMDPKFEKKVIGAKIYNVSRRAKYILIQLDNNITLIIHLGMSGRIAIENLNNNERIFKHTHLEFITSNKKKLKYIDPRRFGSILLCQTNKLCKHKLL